MFDGDMIWITEKEARYNCPKNLKAFNNNEDYDNISESDPDVVQARNQQKKTNRMKAQQV